MVFDRSLAHPELIEHGSTRPGRWLRARRFRLAVWIAVAEGLLVALHVVSWWSAIAVAAILVLFWFWVGHRLRPDVARQASWIAATSQALVALVPVLVLVVGTLALIVVALLAVVALVALFSSRD